MSSSAEIFNHNGYIYLPDFLDKENCQQYVQEFKKLIDQGKARKDEQCPLSFSLGHTSLFDSLLEQLTSNVEAATGKKLLPTYAYARWYAPGDKLKIHQDRPSCEISATITLGFQGSSWPIYMGYDGDKQNCRQINMSVGDAVVYKGCEMYHWREKYVEGQWQAQVFIHYVDANGPNAAWKYDKRDRLAHHNVNEDSHYYKIIKNAFPKKTLKALIDSFNLNINNSVDATLVGDVIDKNVRDSKKIIINKDIGIAATLTGIGLNCNQKLWNFNVTHSNQSEYLQYDKNGHFHSHLDIIMKEHTEETRKLTIITLLNDEYEGGQLYFQYGHQKIYPDLKPGDVVVFPSFILHGVEPVTSGIRRSIVTWLVGPYFK
tara:strand:+ start:1479 stop:2600 length:1122 start_codon:yes stop_codon:yes gene_type:complete